ncbi:unnamed protein product [Soboliphyme baturini]|uniref:MAM domain-containing protein n=1 Tax=Soboliphyme baturini TaxID=241478 RepID=A0A183IAB4_9BILA|nr:unnamed protein product [Soboliphyme baturini]
MTTVNQQCNSIYLELYESPQFPYGTVSGLGHPENQRTYQTGQASFSRYSRPYFDSLNEDAGEAAEPFNLFTAAEADYPTVGFCPAVDCNFTRDFCEWRNEEAGHSQWKIRLQSKPEHYEFYLPPGITIVVQISSFTQQQYNKIS